MTKPPVKRDDFDEGRQERLHKLNALRDASLQRVRHVPTPQQMARRRSRLNLAKWALPALASIMLLSIAAWPEITHLVHQNRAILDEMSRLRFETGRIENAVYRNIDSKNRPYTLTAWSAHQIGDDRINLNHPAADILLGNDRWVHLRADHGVYLQHEQTLNLDGHVVLYRSDGLLMNSPSADMDMKQDIVASHDWIHAEGPFGTQDALGVFLDENAGLIQFIGPGMSVHYNDIVPGPSPAAPQSRP